MRERTLRTCGIILKRLSMGEFDRMVTVFTPGLGKVTVMAKGIKKLNSRRASHLELFNHVDLVLYDRTIPMVTEVSTLTTYSRFRQDITIASLAFYVGEVVDKILPEKQPISGVYELILEVFANLNAIESQELTDCRERGEKIVKQFVSKLLWELGYLPNGTYPQSGLTAMVEEICERQVNSRRFLQEN